MKFLKLYFKGLAKLIPVILAGDLIYLYFAGGWYDPYPFIEITELSVLSLVIIFFSFDFVRWAKRCKSIGLQELETH